MSSGRPDPGLIRVSPATGANAREDRHGERRSSPAVTTRLRRGISPTRGIAGGARLSWRITEPQLGQGAPRYPIPSYTKEQTMQPTTTAGTIVRERPSASRRRPVSAPHLWGIPAISPHAALADGEFVLAPSSPKVYLISGGVRRWVPDPTTYLALAPNGWASLVQVTDAQMASVTEGPAIPSREDGRVYRGADGPDVYVIQSLARHHIPDEQTL